MSNTTDAPKVGGLKPVQFTAKKVFSRSAEEPPYPTYTNAVDFTGGGMDIFMDVGLVSPESIQAAMATIQPNQPPTQLNITVLHRFGMTLHTAIQMQQKLTELLGSIKAQTEVISKTTQTKQGD